MTNLSDKTSYDVIIIGSGMGALTVASILGQLQGKRVLILEQHYIAGGFTHTFKREKGYKWDVGIHYVGDLEDGHKFRRLFDFVTRGGVRWQKMPYIYDKFVFPDFTVEAQADLDSLRSQLIVQFPHEEKALIQYFEDVVRADAWYRKYILYKHIPSLLKPFVKPSKADTLLSTGSTKDYLDAHFSDQKLKGVLTSQWGNYGAVPGQSSFANHAMVVRHFFKGGYYPIGSSKTILQSIEPIVEQYGGAIKINHRVEEIILDGDTAVGVRGQQKKGKDFLPFEYYAPVVVSDAGAYNTYCKLLPASPRIKSRRESLSNHPNGLSHLCLYIGFKESPEKMGFKGENHWIFDDYDHDALFADLDAVTEDRMKMAFLSFPSLKDPEAKAHTGEIITFVSYDYFKKWSTERWKNRGEDYEAVKQEIAERMLNFIEGKYPGFKEMVDFYELSTPLTTEHFTLHRNGEIYGMHTTPDRLLKDWNQVKTPIKNLYLTGTDAAVLGVAGAFTGGVFASVELMGKSLGLLHYIKLEGRAEAFAKELKSKGIRTVFGG
jgi:phytoene dehydrogenase-like protein